MPTYLYVLDEEAVFGLLVDTAWFLCPVHLLKKRPAGAVLLTELQPPKRALCSRVKER